MNNINKKNRALRRFSIYLDRLEKIRQIDLASHKTKEGDRICVT
jgi:hypothetical protein